MKAIRKLGIGLGLALSLAACGQQTQQTWTPSTNYAYKVDDDTLYLYWNCVPQPSGMLVQGYVHNVLASPMKNAQVLVSGVEATGKTVSSTQASGLPYMLQLGARAPFAVIVKASGDEVRYDLWYDYDVGGLIASGNDQRGVKANACPVMPR